MSAEDSPDRNLDFYRREGTEQWNLNQLTSNLVISLPKFEPIIELLGRL